MQLEYNTVIISGVTFQKCSHWYNSGTTVMGSLSALILDLCDLLDGQ